MEESILTYFQNIGKEHLAVIIAIYLVFKPNVDNLIGHLASLITKKRWITQKEMYQNQQRVIIQTSIGILWGDKAPFIEVVRAGLLALRAGANGNIRERLLEVIIGYGDKGRELYNTLCNEFVKKEGMTLELKEGLEWLDKRLS